MSSPLDAQNDGNDLTGTMGSARSYDSNTSADDVPTHFAPAIMENGLTAIDNVKVSRRKRMFFAQLLISLSTLAWLLWQLSVTEDADWRTALFSALSGIMGYWMPSPLS